MWFFVSGLSKTPQDWYKQCDGNKLSTFWKHLEYTKKLQILDPNTIKSLEKEIILPHPFNDHPYRVGDLIEYLGQKETHCELFYTKINSNYGIESIFNSTSLLTHLMNLAHHGASGGEKENIRVKQQNGNLIYISTPFGYEKESFSPSELEGIRKSLEKSIVSYLNKDIERKRYLKSCEQAFVRGVGDTQRPLNDVRIWDLAHSGAAFLKTGIASSLLSGEKLTHDDIANTKHDKMNSKQLWWRGLALRFDGLEFLGGSTKVAGILWRRNCMEESLDRAKSLLEEELSIAQEVYRDENGSLFVFPDLDETTDVYKTVREQIEENTEIDLFVPSLMLSPKSKIHPKKSGGHYIGNWFVKVIRTPSRGVYLMKKCREMWDNRAEVCIECGLRPQGYGADEIDEYENSPQDYSRMAKERGLCCVCMSKLSGRVKEWSDNLSTTIWMDEVADLHGRIALITGKIEVDTFTPVYPSEDKSKKSDESNKCGVVYPVFLSEEPPDGHVVDIKIKRKEPFKFKWSSNLGAFINDDKEKPEEVPENRFKKNAVSIKDSEYLVKDVYKVGNSYRVVIEGELPDSIGGMVKVFGQDFSVIDKRTIEASSDEAKKKVEDVLLYGDDRCIFYIDHTKIFYIDHTKVVDKATTSYSFARIRRIWETTKRFWQDVLPTEGDIKLSDVRGILQPLPRLMLEADKVEGDVHPNHVYELMLGDIGLNVVYLDNNKFITAHNLCYIAKRLGEKQYKDVSEAVEKVKGELIKLKGKETELYDGEKVGSVVIESVKDATSYIPAIPILAEPRTFMALVPADRAIEVAKSIKQKYEREMGKVQDRLPLHVGVVFADAHMPLRAILDAGRKMLDVLSNMRRWRVVCACQKGPSELPKHLRDDSHFTRWMDITLEEADDHQKDGRTMRLRVPLKMGDGTTDDEWYPYFYLDGNEADVADRERVLLSTKPTDDGDEPCWLVHASELKEGDVVWCMPSTLDFVWLDDASRRFEVAYDDEGARLSRPIRPYLLCELEQLERLWGTVSRGLTQNQWHQLIRTIEQKREEWLAEGDDKAFSTFVGAALSNAQWRRTIGQKEFEELKRAAISGMLYDVFELYTQVMRRDMGE